LCHCWGDVISEAPARLQAQLFAAFALELVYNKQDHQVTIQPRSARAGFRGAPDIPAPVGSEAD